MATDNTSMNVGDVVCLRSSKDADADAIRPRMTVSFIGSSGIVCVWFGEDGSVRRDTFPAATLFVLEKR